MSLGLDIGHFKSKVIHLSLDGDVYKVINHGSKDSFSEIKSFDPDMMTKAQWVANIQDLLNSMKINPRAQKKISSSLIGSSTTIKQIVTLELGGDELTQSLEFEAKKHIPLDGTEVIMDYHILGENNKDVGKIDVLLVATTKNLINQHNQMLKEIGFKKTGVFDATPIALTNLHIFNKGIPKEGCDVIINIGSKSTTIVAYGQNQDFFTRELNIAGHSITKEVMEKNNIDYEEAEKMKLELGVKSINNSSNMDNSEFTIQVSEKTVLSNFIDELRKSLRYYMKSNPQAFFSTIYITGGSAKLFGLKDYIANELNSKVELLDPFENISIKDGLNFANPYQYSVSVGLALRGLK